MTLKGWRLVGLVVVAAFVGGLAAFGVERAFQAGMPQAMATRTPVPTSQVAAQPLPTTIPTPMPTPRAGDQLGRQLAETQQQMIQMEGLLLVQRATAHVALANDSLERNDLVTTNQELVAAHAALDGAFERVGEALKQVIDNQRREVGRVRADLYIAPEGLDDRLRTMQDQLLALPLP